MSDFPMKFVQPDPYSVVCLERCTDAPEPDYCVHGKTRCTHCNQWCWLGQETFEFVSAGQATPLCLPCATKIETDKPGTFRRPYGNLDDRHHG